MSDPSTTPSVFVLTGSTSHRDLAEVVGKGTRMLGEALAACHHRIGEATRWVCGCSFDLGDTMRELHECGRLDGFRVR